MKVLDANTDPLLLLIQAATLGVPAAFDSMESAGQQAVAQSSQLPVGGTLHHEAEYEALGIKLGPVDPKDNLFRDATLPEGWKIVPHEEHAMWSDLVDHKGRKRASIFYKSAFYDRSASIGLVTRFQIHEVFDDEDTQCTFAIRDCGQEVFRVSQTTPSRRNDTAAWRAAISDAEERCREECRQWLKDMGREDYKNPAKYWDETTAWDHLDDA